MSGDTVHPGSSQDWGDSALQPSWPGAHYLPRISLGGSLNDEDNLDEEEQVMEVVVKEEKKPLTYTTAGVVEFFDRSKSWLYWGLRGKFFTDDSGVPIKPQKRGNRRLFTTVDIRNIMKSMYRSGVISLEDMKVILRRLHYAEKGIEWREMEGWRFVKLGSKHWRWVKPQYAQYDESIGHWVVKPGVDYEQ